MVSAIHRFVSNNIIHDMYTPGRLEAQLSTYFTVKDALMKMATAKVRWYNTKHRFGMYGSRISIILLEQL